MHLIIAGSIAIIIIVYSLWIYIDIYKKLLEELKTFNNRIDTVVNSELAFRTLIIKEVSNNTIVMGEIKKIAGEVLKATKNVSKTTADIAESLDIYDEE